MKGRDIEFQQLKDRINCIEAELEIKDRKIDRIKEELEEVRGRLRVDGIVGNNTRAKMTQYLRD